MNTYSEAIARAWEAHHDRLFLIDAKSGDQWTYGQSRTIAQYRATSLLKHGLKKGDRLGLLMPNSVSFALWYFTCLEAGIIAVPLNPALHQDEIHFLANNAGLKLILTSEMLKWDWSAFDTPTLTVKDQIESDELKPSSPLPALMDDSRCFSITFTSGTTSRPKGIVHSIHSLFGNARVFNQAMGSGTQCRFLHVLPMAYMAGFLNTLITPFFAGSSVVIAPAFGPQTALNFWKIVTQFEANTFWLTPTMLSSLLVMDRGTIGSEYCRQHATTFCVGTAPLPRKTKNDFDAKYGVRTLESYGLSEFLFIAGNLPSESERIGSVGKVLDGIEIELRDEAGHPAGKDQEGEIFIRTSWQLFGTLDYDTNTILHAEKVFYSTGDIGRLDEDGRLYITGRKKDLIIRGGTNVSPRTIEESLLLHPSIANVAVIGLPHDFYGEEVVAALILKPGLSFPQEEPSIKAWAKEKLSALAQPNRYLAMQSFPQSVTGKVQKNKLREFLQSPSSS